MRYFTVSSIPTPAPVQIGGGACPALPPVKCETKCKIKTRKKSKPKQKNKRTRSHKNTHNKKILSRKLPDGKVLKIRLPKKTTTTKKVVKRAKSKRLGIFD